MTNMKLYTIGYSKKSAEEFFDLLRDNNVKRVVDIRRHNTNQLAGFTKQDDLAWFLKVIANIEYQHVLELAPSEDLMHACLLYTSPSPRDATLSRMPSSA